LQLKKKIQAMILKLPQKHCEYAEFSVLLKATASHGKSCELFAQNFWGAG